MPQTQLFPGPLEGPELEQAIGAAAEAIRRGGLAVFPTETVYGLGANALDETAVKGIFRAKGRPGDNPLIVHIAEYRQIEALCRDIPHAAKTLAETFWPGPLTMVLPKTDAVPGAVTAGLDSVGVRMPSHPIALALIRAAGVPIAAPSANRSGAPSPTTYAHAVQDMSGRADVILDGGDCAVGLESTVLSLLGPVPTVLRPGAVTPEMIESVLGEVAVDPAVLRGAKKGERVLSPGVKYKHYTPSAEVVLLEGERAAVARYVNQNAQEGDFALCNADLLGELRIPGVALSRDGTEKQAAQRLFWALRELDERGARRAFAYLPHREGLGLAIYNRLVRAAGFQVIYVG